MESGGINLAGSNAPVLIKALSKTAEGAVALKIGDIIKAKVTASSQENAVLNIGGLRIPVSTKLPLTPGETIALVVAEVRPDKVTLKRLDRSSSNRPSVKYSKADVIDYVLRNIGLRGRDLSAVTDILRGNRVDIGDGFARMAESLAALSEGERDGVDPGKLLSLLHGIVVEASDHQGIEPKIRAMAQAVSWEAELVKYLGGETSDTESLKMQLLEARAQLQGRTQPADAGPLSILKASIEKVLDLLNAIEVLNLPVDLQMKDALYLPLPIRFGDDVLTAEIRISIKSTEEGAEKSGSSTFTIAFALDMPSLGRTRALLESVDRFVNFSLSAENHEVLNGVKDPFGELEESLRELGYTVGRMSIIEFKDENPKGLIEDKFGLRLEGIDIRA